MEKHARLYSSGQIKSTKDIPQKKKVLDEKHDNMLYKNAIKNPKSSAKDILHMTKHVLSKNEVFQQ